MKDLWPDTFVDPNQTKAPVAVLREQASFLGEKTNNLVTAEVKPLGRQIRKSQDDPFMPPDAEPEEEFKYIFYLVAPALDHYRYRLFTIGNNIELYPVTLYWSQETEETTKEQVTMAYNQQELEGMLTNIFSASRTQRVIRAMLLQSEEREVDDIPF